MSLKKPVLRIQTPIESMIVLVRGERIILDVDLAAVYGVTTKRLNEQVKRNKKRFPTDFYFQLTKEEWNSLNSTIEKTAVFSDNDMRSQNATASRRNIRFKPFAFTEHGAIMAANVLNSPRAVEMSVFVVRAFIRMRGLLVQNRELARKLADLEREIKKRLDVHETAIVGILQRIMALIDPPPRPPAPKKRPIGFGTKED